MLGEIIEAVISLFWDPKPRPTEISKKPQESGPEPTPEERKREDVEGMERTLMLASAGYRQPTAKAYLLDVAKTSLAYDPDRYWAYMCGAVLFAMRRYGLPRESLRWTMDERLSGVIKARPSEAPPFTAAAVDDLRTAITLAMDEGLYDADERHKRFDYEDFRAEHMVEATYGPILRTFAMLTVWDGIARNLSEDEVGDELVQAATDFYISMWLEGSA